MYAIEFDIISYCAFTLQGIAAVSMKCIAWLSYCLDFGPRYPTHTKDGYDVFLNKGVIFTQNLHAFFITRFVTAFGHVLLQLRTEAWTVQMGLTLFNGRVTLMIRH